MADVQVWLRGEGEREGGGGGGREEHLPSKP